MQGRIILCLQNYFPNQGSEDGIKKIWEITYCNHSDFRHQIRYDSYDSKTIANVRSCLLGRHSHFDQLIQTPFTRHNKQHIICICEKPTLFKVPFEYLNNNDIQNYGSLCKKIVIVQAVKQEKWWTHTNKSKINCAYIGFSNVAFSEIKDATPSISSTCP